jgi:hypothetical protein
VALFIIAKSWNQPRCPSTDEWIKTIWYICTMENYSATKKNEKKMYGTGDNLVKQNKQHSS